jgi:hypothetical protein
MSRRWREVARFSQGPASPVRRIGPSTGAVVETLGTSLVRSPASRPRRPQDRAGAMGGPGCEPGSRFRRSSSPIRDLSRKRSGGPGFASGMHRSAAAGFVHRRAVSTSSLQESVAGGCTGTRWSAGHLRTGHQFATVSPRSGRPEWSYHDGNQSRQHCLEAMRGPEL